MTGTAIRLIVKSAAVLVTGTALGLLATWLAVMRGNLAGGISDGPWRTNLAIGSTRSDPYTRAYVALHGLFALNRTETIYYTANTDNDGDALSGKCRYRISGRDPDARWWSVTAYGSDDFLIPNPANRYSVAASTIRRKADGSFDVRIGGTAPDQNWIPTGGRHFSLTLRLYNPGPALALDPGHATLPAIEKVSCP